MWEEVNVSELILIVFKCIDLELVPLRGKKCSGHAHKTDFCYLLGVLFKISDDQHHHF